jgi:putative SOS response-associated peptidase YedK
MCASYQSRFNLLQLVEAFDKAGAPIDTGAGLPNLAEVDEVRPTDRAPAILAGTGGGTTLAMLSFGFPAPRPKARPVVNLRSEGRVFENRERTGRCLIPMTGFYEFTGDKYPKTRWLFSDPVEPILCLAGVWRAGEGGEAGAFALLTAEPGPDIAPYHDRGVVVAPPDRWAEWLGADSFPEDLVRAAPEGSLAVSAAPRPAKGEDLLL